MTPFAWRVAPERDWPPPGRPHRPFGPTSIEIIRSCPARAAFGASRAYERRLGFSARVGLAMHAALESLVSDPIGSPDPAQVALQARTRFDAMLSQQLALAQHRVRERFLEHDAYRVESAAEGVVAEALRVQRLASFGDQAPNWAEGRAVDVEVEVIVRSTDGLLEGVVDRAERDERGVRLIDYKSTTRDELPDRYRRQVQLYAYLWHETRGEWPVSGRVIYSALGKSHVVDVDPEECLSVASEAHELLTSLAEQDSVPAATPGDVCSVCEYRPWCTPFWEWVSGTGSGERLERAAFGVEATVTAFQTDDGTVRIAMLWSGLPVSIALGSARFPHASGLAAGDRVRLLDLRLRGLRSRPTIFATPSTELFLVEGAEP